MKDKDFLNGGELDTLYQLALNGPLESGGYAQ